MKIIITENKLEKILKQSGVIKTIELLGGWDNFCNVYNIESPMDFLHLFDNLEQVQSKSKENWTIFRYSEGKNLMVYDRKYRIVYINFDEIWRVLDKLFGLTDDDVESHIEKWFDEVHNLKGVTARWNVGIV